MSADNQVVASFRHETEAQLLAGRLSAEGLTPQVRQAGDARSPIPVWFTVSVPPDQFEQAEAISSHDHGEALEELHPSDPITCSRCGAQGLVQAPPRFIAKVVGALVGASPSLRRRCPACGKLA